MAFETDQPVLGPIRDAIDGVMKVFLLNFVLSHQRIALAFQFFDHMPEAANVKSKHTGHGSGRQAGARPRRVVDSHQWAGYVKQEIEAIQNDGIQIDKQASPLQAIQIATENANFGPCAVVVMAVLQPDVGNGKHLNVGQQALRLGCQTDKSKFARYVALASAVQHVDVFGGVQGAPLHAKHNFRLVHGVISWEKVGLIASGRVACAPS